MHSYWNLPLVFLCITSSKCSIEDGLELLFDSMKCHSYFLQSLIVVMTTKPQPSKPPCWNFYKCPWPMFICTRNLLLYCCYICVAFQELKQWLFHLYEHCKCCLVVSFVDHNWASVQQSLWTLFTHVLCREPCKLPMELIFGVNCVGFSA